VGFPDAAATLEDILAEGDRVAYRTTIRGTHRGTFQGIPPTGRR
jgi:predicted ester cyclase